MTQLFTRRDFLKITGATATAVAAGGLLPAPVAKAARDAGLIDPNGDGYIPSLCEMCVWRCGLLAKVRNGRVVKLEGNPDNPHSTGKLCARGQSGQARPSYRCLSDTKRAQSSNQAACRAQKAS